MARAAFPTEVKTKSEGSVYQLYDYHTSGNGYKVALLLHQLKLPFRYIETDILAGAAQTASFLALNPNAKIPVLVTPDEKVLSESNAILLYLAEGTSFLPQDRDLRFEVHRWLFWEQYSHEPYIATSRFWRHHPQADQFAAKIAERRPGGLKALALMEDHLANRTFLVGDDYSIADIALYAYTHKADEGGFALADYPAVRVWLERVAAVAGHITLAQKTGFSQGA